VARLRFSEEFLDSLVELDGRVEEAVWKRHALVGSLPGEGSSLVEPSLRHAYGPTCLKVATAGYDVLYERGARDADGEEVVCVLGVVGQRTVR
jgi:hypothetical protein